jgi:hypothetical protein
MDFDAPFDWSAHFANAWAGVFSGEISAPHSADEWSTFLASAWDAYELPVVAAAPEPAPAAEPVVYDLSNVSWNEGAPGTDATYFDGVSFASGTVSYVTTAAPGPLPYGGSIKLVFELTGGPLKSSTGQSDSAGVFLYIQRAGDDWSGQGAYNDYRLWSQREVWLGGVAEGIFEIEVPLTPEHWGGVVSDESAAGFSATLASPGALGFTLLNEIGKGKGSAADSDARITVLEYKVLA